MTHPRRFTAPLLGALCLLAAGCGTTRTYQPDPGPYDRVPKAWRPELERAREALLAGRARRAHDIVRPLTAQRPEVLPVRAFLQDLQIDLLSRGEAVGGFQVAPGKNAATELGDRYLVFADANPDTPGYVLAARLASSGSEGLRLLERAREGDPECVWIDYGTAWWNARMRRFPAAREAVERVFGRDPGHLPTMRLHASLLAGAGDTELATRVLELWVERSRDDPLVLPDALAEAEVDLAALRLLEGDADEALVMLREIDLTELRDPARAELLFAVVYEDLGERALALSAARRARGLAPDQELPLLHQALLLSFEGNTTQERQAWKQLLEEAEAREAAGDELESLGISSLLFTLRANVRLQRIEQSSGTAIRPRGTTP